MMRSMFELLHAGVFYTAKWILATVRAGCCWTSTATHDGVAKPVACGTGGGGRVTRLCARQPRRVAHVRENEAILPSKRG